MFKKITYLFVVCLGLLAVSCKKEVVTPSNPANPTGVAIMEHRDGEAGQGGSTSGGGNTDPGGNTTTQNDSTITTEEGTDDGGGITDGGNSSEHDSKGKRKKTN